MPLYEYRCRQCNQEFDQLRPIADADAAIACPACSSLATNRSLSVIAAPKVGLDSPQQSRSQHTCACGGACACGRH